MYTPLPSQVAVERATLATRLRRSQTELNTAGTLLGFGVVTVIIGLIATQGLAIALACMIGGVAVGALGVRKLVRAGRTMHDTRKQLFLLDRRPQLPEARVIERRDK